MFFRVTIFSLLLCLCSCGDPRSEREKFRDRILSQLAKHMSKEHVYAIGLGGGCNLERKINLIEMAFQYRQLMTIEAARKLMVESVETLLELINSNPKSKEYFEIFPAPVDIIHIYIVGETPETEHEILGVQIVKGKVYYSIYNTAPLPQKGGSLLTVHEETFEEAQKIVSDSTSKCMS